MLVVQLKRNLEFEQHIDNDNEYQRNMLITSIQYMFVTHGICEL